MGDNSVRVQVSRLIEEGDLLINDGYRAKNTELSSIGLPFARAQNVNNGFRFDGDVDRFPEKDLHKVGLKVSQPGDVVFTSKGTVGRFAYVRTDTSSFVYSPQLCFWRSLNHKRLQPRWLFYWMHSREFFEQYSGVAGQTDMAEYVSLRDQRRMHISVPPIDLQRAIACILGSLDDKIELNRRMNRTLEEMARAIFKSWFIDFDPVRAKAAVRRQHPKWTDEQVSRAACPKLKPEIARLFPDSFEPSELGEIPKGWRVQSFTDEVEVIGGGTPKTSVPEFWGGEIPWFSVVDTPTLGDVFVISTEKTITTEGVNNSSARVLPVGTTIISARGTVGNLALVGVPMAMNQSCYGLHPRHGHCGYYLYFATNALLEVLRQRAHGSVFSTITRETLSGTQVVAPPDRLIEAFERVVSGQLKRILANQRQSRTLAALRDALLSKLISGELRIKDAERIAQRKV